MKNTKKEMWRGLSNELSERFILSDKMIALVNQLKPPPLYFLTFILNVFLCLCKVWLSFVLFFVFIIRYLPLGPEHARLALMIAAAVEENSETMRNK